MAESMRPHVPSVVREPPVVEKVLYGIGKFIEKNTPMAHSDRILTAVNRYIIPKLKPEQMAWVRKHKDAIETASVIAGVGITATEITLATVFTVRMVKRFRGALERVRANRPVRPMESRRPEPGRATLQEVAKGKRKSKGKELPVVYDRTNELLLVQELAEAGPQWETPTSRALAEGKLVLRENERVDWDRLGLPDPTKKVVHTSTNFFEPVDSYAHKSRPSSVVEPKIPVERGIGDVIRDKIEEIWPWSFQNRELSARRRKFDAEKARKMKKAADLARAKQQEIWDAQRMQMIARQEMNMDLDHRNRLQEAIERGNAERHRLEALNAVIESGSRIDPVLARKNPPLVARFAEKMSVGDTTATRDIARIIVQIAEKPDAYQSMLRNVADATDEQQALKAAAQLFQRAYNTLKGVRKIDGEYTTKFTTLASVWLHRFGKEGLDLLLKK